MIMTLMLNLYVSVSILFSLHKMDISERKGYILCIIFVLIFRQKLFLLAGLGEGHARERGGQSLSVHLTTCALKIIVLPYLRIG